MSAEAFILAFPQNMAMQQEQQHFTAMVATGIALGRILLPVGQHGLRLAWHAWDRVKGGWHKVEGEDELDMPENIAATMQQQQQQLQQQQVTFNRTVKADADGIRRFQQSHQRPIFCRRSREPVVLLGLVSLDHDHPTITTIRPIRLPVSK